MTFDLHIHGETPAELLDALQQLNASPIQSPQSKPVAQPDKPKAPASAKAKKTAQKPAAGAAENAANPTAADTSASASKKDAEQDVSDPAGANPTTSSAESPTTAGTSGSTPEPDPATLDKIRDLARSLIVHGKRAEVQQIIKSTGAASISKLPPASYTDVWEQLVNLSKEVDSNAAG